MQRARFILIDEFQDSNVAQIELTRLLGGDERNVFAVGDPIRRSTGFAAQPRVRSTSFSTPSAHAARNAS